VLTGAAEAFLQARAEGDDPVAAVLAKVSEQELQATVASAENLLRPENLDSLDLIESRYTPMRQSLLSLYQALDFQPVRRSEPALQALEYVSMLSERRKRVTAREQKVGKVKLIAPLGHLTECRRYRAFEGYLLPQAHFDQLASAKQTRLAVTHEAQAYLDTMQREITEKLVALQESIGKVEGSLVLDDKGQLHLPPLEREIPEEVERVRTRVYDMLPQLALPDLLLELDNWTGFLRPLTHLTSGDAPVGEEKLVLVAALMGMGMNLGLTKMEQSCPYTYRQLSWSVDWHLREETLLACLDNFVLSAPLSRHWGDGTTSSSDGMRLSVGVKAANAEHNAKYFGAGRGANLYSHAADIWMPFGKPQIIGTNEEALYVIDALCHHESDLHIREHYTDREAARSMCLPWQPCSASALPRTSVTPSPRNCICWVRRERPYRWGPWRSARSTPNSSGSNGMRCGAWLPPFVMVRSPPPCWMPYRLLCSDEL
jgi:Tn3 transposase DDE domain-containing protein